MLWRRWWGDISWDIVEYRLQLLVDTILLCQLLPQLQRYPSTCGASDMAWKRAVSVSTLVFPVSTLHLFMEGLLNLPFQNPGSRWLIKVGDFENLRCIYPAISSATHNVILIDVELIHRNLKPVSGGGAQTSDTRRLSNGGSAGRD